MSRSRAHTCGFFCSNIHNQTKVFPVSQVVLWHGMFLQRSQDSTLTRFTRETATPTNETVRNLLKCKTPLKGSERPSDLGSRCSTSAAVGM